MAFESVRGYFQLASGLGELSRARAMEAAQGLLSLPGVGIATGKVAVQVGTLAEELLAAATTNREHLTTLVRSEVDAAVTRLGLVPAEKLEQSRTETARLRAEAARLRAEVARLRSDSTIKDAVVKKTAAARAVPGKNAAAKAAASRTAAARTTAGKTPSAKAAAKTSSKTKAVARPVAARPVAARPAAASKLAKSTAKGTAVRRSSVTTRRKPAGT